MVIIRLQVDLPPAKGIAEFVVCVCRGSLGNVLVSVVPLVKSLAPSGRHWHISGRKISEKTYPLL